MGDINKKQKYMSTPGGGHGFFVCKNHLDKVKYT
jgi:hypothetical protein